VSVYGVRASVVGGSAYATARSQTWGTNPGLKLLQTRH
jgi:hypothetical protein